MFSVFLVVPQILLPRPDGGQMNTSVLDLGNHSTTAIDIPSADSTLLLKVCLLVLGLDAENEYVMDISTRPSLHLYMQLCEITSSIHIKKCF